MLAFFLAAGIATANAQACHASAGTGKSCCANKAASAAAADPTIEKRQADDGTMSYVRKEADQQGNVRFVSVQFDETQNGFVNVAPPATATAAETSGMTKKEATACGAGEKKACCAKSGKACTGAKSAAAEQ
ncbi:MAG: hypothetical protein ABIQ93_15545 [Saprospiraceae bacterium]